MTGRLITVRVLFPKDFKLSLFFLAPLALKGYQGMVEELQLWGKATCSSEQIKGMKNMFLAQVEIFLFVEKREILPRGYYGFGLVKGEEPRGL